MGFLGEIDVDASLDQFVNQRLILQEGFLAVGGYNQSLDAFFCHGFHQFSIESMDSDTHQDFVLFLRIIGDETLQVESGRILVPDMFGYGDTTVFNTIDIGVLRMDAGEGDVVDGLHADTHHP